MKKHIVGTLVLLALIVGLQGGCATVSEEHKGAATGAGIGAATGALAGAVLAGEGSRTQGAIIGGLAGALVGGVIGSYTVDKKKNAEDTTNQYGYDPSAGVVIRIESTAISPASIYRGDRVDLKATYALMAPQSDTRIAVTEIREIRFNGELIGKPEVNTTHIAGTYESNVPLFLADDAKRGNYQVITTIRTQNSSDSRETSFTVR
ncbi:MAG: glycine zipper 2TM domain-containing protein [Desulfuromonadales bacterium]|nr:glycine zipper 2TM domain-containing protein [Desulfuromonadales bacterium]